MRLVCCFLFGFCFFFAPATAADRSREAADGFERSAALSLYSLQQTLWHAADDRKHGIEAVRAWRFRRQSRPPENVRRLPRHRYDGKQARSIDPGCEAAALSI